MFRNIISLIFVAAAVVLFLNWTQPVIVDIKNLISQENILNSTLSELKELQELRNDIMEEYNSISESDLEYLNKFLPSESNSIELVIEIDNIAKRNGLLLKNIDVKNPEKKENISIIPISMKLSGSSFR